MRVLHPNARQVVLGGGDGPVDCAVTCADAIQDAEEAATAAERLRAYDWHVIGRDTVTLTWSDPQNLADTYDLDTDTGIATITTNPLTQTANPSLFAGWEGQIFGKVANQSFAVHVNAILMRIKFDPDFTPPAGTDIELIVMAMNGPRATADFWFGGGWVWSTAGTTWRSRAVRNRAGSQSSGTATIDSNAAVTACVAQSNVSNVWQVASRGLFASGALPGGNANLGAQISGGGAPTNQAAWGTETWMFMGIGSRGGTDASSRTLRFYADVTRTAVDMTSASFPL